MKNFYLPAILATGLALASINPASSQAVSRVVTDYNGWWQSSAANPSSAKPDRSHNVLAFTYNGVEYSTGVDDAVLAAHGENFTPGDWWSLPVGSLSNNLTGNTKCGFGALYDGVYGGASNPPPQHGIGVYLTDGVKGLNMGTCIANLPAGSISFMLFNVDPTKIGDGIPDILVSQVADPAGNSFDRYQFTDASGNPIGSQLNVVFNSINPVGTWTADFYEASNNPLTLQGGFTQTDRPVRLWAADLADFNILPSQASQLRGFRITLCGNSDVAFVAYNNRTMNIQQPLAVDFISFEGRNMGGKTRLEWTAGAERPGDIFYIEKSSDGRSFRRIGSVTSTQTGRYRFEDALAGAFAYYRIYQISLNKSESYSKTVHVRDVRGAVTVSLAPNPASDRLRIQLAGDDKLEMKLRNASGHEVKKLNAQFAVQLDVSDLPAGYYFLCWNEEGEQHSLPVLIRH